MMIEFVFFSSILTLLNGMNLVNPTIKDYQLKERTIALTFDDGPTNNIPSIIKMLFNMRTRCTFHIIIKNLTDSKLIEQVKQAHRQGNDIGIKLDPSLNEDELLDEEMVVASLTNDASYLEKLVEIKPKFVRLPNGMATESLVTAIQQAGFVVTQPNLDSSDNQEGVTVNDIVDAYDFQLLIAPDDVSSFVSVQRESVHNTVAAIPGIISIARMYGYRVGSLSDCLKQK